MRGLGEQLPSSSTIYIGHSGVLTKPDVLGSGAIGSHLIWKQTLENRLQNNPNYLQHGYYCVRLPDDAQRQRGYTAHNLPDANYFDVTEPWSQVADRERFGVTNIVRDVSALLVQLIEAKYVSNLTKLFLVDLEYSLPRLRAAVAVALQECTNRLSHLPLPPQGEHPMANIMLLVNEFLRDLDAADVGDSHKVLAQKCRTSYENLRISILNTCPQFGPNRGQRSDIYDIEAVTKVIKEYAQEYLFHIGLLTRPFQGAPAGNYLVLSHMTCTKLLLNDSSKGGTSLLKPASMT